MFEFVTEIERADVYRWAGWLLVVPVTVTGVLAALEARPAVWVFRRLGRLGRRLPPEPCLLMFLTTLPLFAAADSLCGGHPVTAAMAGVGGLALAAYAAAVQNQAWRLMDELDAALAKVAAGGVS